LGTPLIIKPMKYGVLNGKYPGNDIGGRAGRMASGAAEMGFWAGKWDDVCLFLRFFHDWR
jgi:hypothetical protein